MLSSKYISFLLCVALLSCHMLVPLVEAGHHGHNNQALAYLLAVGLLAKILGNHKHEEHHIHIPVPVHHHEQHHGHHEHHKHHASGTTRFIVHHPAPFHHLYGGMMGSPSFASRVMYTPPGPVYPQPPLGQVYPPPPPEQVYPQPPPNY